MSITHSDTVRGQWAFHLTAILIVGIWGLTFISTKLLIGCGMTPQEIFLLRFSVAYIGIWFLSHRKWWADTWRDELWLLLGGVTWKLRGDLTLRRFVLLPDGEYGTGIYAGHECLVSGMHHTAVDHPALWGVFQKREGHACAGSRFVDSPGGGGLGGMQRPFCVAPLARRRFAFVAGFSVMGLL